MNCKELMTWMAWPIILITLAGCAAPGPQIPREALKPLPAIILPTAPVLHTRKLLDAQGQPAGLLFRTADAFAAAEYQVGLKEAAELGQANTGAANRIFAILRTPPRHWWQFWK